MASTTKKDSKKSKAKPRRPVVKTSQPKQAQNIQSLRRNLDESLEREAATSDILRMIARSPADLQIVLDAIAERAARLCDAEDAAIFRVDGNFLRLAAHFGPIPMADAVGGGRVLDRGTPAGRAIIDQQTIHVHDLRAADAEFPDAKTRGIAMGVRTVLDTPLLREGIAIGAIHVRRREVRPFSDRQIKLLETFADQAVIAIENVRLFQELRESLEQQTATSEILGVIARSPTDIQPVLDTVIANAVRLVGAKQGHIRLVDGEFLRLAAHCNESDENVANFRARPVPANSDGFVGRVLRERQPIHVPDAQAEAPGQYVMGKQTGTRTMLGVPLLREGTGVGTISIWRNFVEPFTHRQIKLVRTFADQAVIAIENVRLFKEIQERNAELREALEHQTATAEVLGIISRSPTDLQPVFDAIVESVSRLCKANLAWMSRSGGNRQITVAFSSAFPAEIRELINHGTGVPGEGSIHNRAVVERQIIHIPDTTAEPELLQRSRVVRLTNSRSVLAAPLLCDGLPIGAIVLARYEVRPFSQREIALVKTFADQAVIAIENVRLFQELRESLEQQTATSEILGVIARSPTELQPVLDVVAENAARLCDANDAQIIRVEGNAVVPVATYGTLLPAHGIALNRDSPSGRAILDRQTLHIHDLATEIETEFPEVADFQKRLGHRTTLATPLLREGGSIGAILIRRLEVRPFTEKHIKLLETFAAQAVIAIENVRLFKELQERNAELREALEHQTATSEVLGIISRSPTDVQPVLDAIVESAARVCGIDDVTLRLHEGNTLVIRAHFGPIPIPIGREEISTDTPQFRWMREHGTLHVPDVDARRNDFPTLGVISRTYFTRAPSSAWGDHWNPERTAHRAAALHPGANQTS